MIAIHFSNVEFFIITSELFKNRFVKTAKKVPKTAPLKIAIDCYETLIDVLLLSICCKNSLWEDKSLCFRNTDSDLNEESSDNEDFWGSPDEHSDDGTSELHKFEQSHMTEQWQGRN